MIEAIRTLGAAQAAVTTKLRANWSAYLKASLAPGLGAAAVLLWMVEAYWAAVGLFTGQVAILVCALAAVICLSSLAVGRMIRIALGAGRPTAGWAGLAVDETDGRILLASLGLVALASVCVAAEILVGHIVGQAFVAPGSGAIARPVLAVADASIVVATYYLLARAAMFLPAQAAGQRWRFTDIWRATDGHGAILFTVALAVPFAVAAILACPMLWWIGALPWPSPMEFARAQGLIVALHARLWLVAPAILAGLLGGWAFMAAGLSAAWEALEARGTLASPVGA